MHSENYPQMFSGHLLQLKQQYRIYQESWLKSIFINSRNH